MEQPLLAEGGTSRSIHWRPRILFALLLSYFVLFGVVIGVQGVLWADIVRTLNLSKGAFGMAQLISPLISVVLLLMGGQLSHSFGKKWLALVSLTVLSLSVATLAWSANLAGLLLALVFAGIGNGLLETAMNGATLDWEQATGRNAMNTMHAGFSGGAVAGAFGAGLLLGGGWNYSQILLMLMALCVLAILITLPVRYSPQDLTTTAPSSGAILHLFTGNTVLITLTMLCLLGVVGESVANLWSVIYLRELGAEATLGGMAFALFNGAMFIGRLLNTPLLNRWGARVSLCVSGVGLISSMLLLLIPGSVTLAITAFMLMGLGVAGVVPTVLSVAAQRVPGNSGAVAGGIMAGAYVCFIVSPPVIGWAAELLSFRAAWLAVGLSGLLIVWLARGLHTQR